MSKQLTAVEWLEKKGFEGFITTEDFEQAKEFEKRQIVNAHLTGLIYPLEKEASIQAKEYYNETYGSKY